MELFEKILPYLIYVVLLSPLLASLISGAFGGTSKKISIGFINSGFILISFIASLILAIQVFCYEYKAGIEMFEWLDLYSLRIAFGFMIDEVNSVMIVVVTLVSLLVHLYSIEYMKNDKGFNRYFSFLSLFVFSMLFLVLSDNFLGLFIGWEGVGVCSYLLIGFFYEKKSANFASIEAFISNRIADLFLMVGIFMIFIVFGSLEYEQVFEQIILNYHILNQDSMIILMIIGILLFIGAMGKSAQFPFHTWLANAMEGPTPVSALIHAATMVTAGVYLIIRTNPLYVAMPAVGELIAYLGAFVAVFAASMALVNKDLKRIIAYSTLSQLGYMFVAAGLGAYWIALFHLFTHAFFKSLLFLGAGNIMHAMNDRLDITKMGGLAKPLKYTALFMLIGNLALCGIPPLAGYFSKDLIIEFAYNSNYKIIFGILVFGAFLTAFYSFRLFMLVFVAPARHNIEHPHEAGKLALYSMLPLCILAIIAGLGYESFENFIQRSIYFSMPHGDMSELILGLIILSVVVVGIILAIIKYKNPRMEASLDSNVDTINEPESKNIFYKLLFNQYYIPRLYEIIFVKFFNCIARFCSFIESIGEKILDNISKTFIILSKVLSKIQNGNLTSYMRLMFIGLFVILIAVLLLAVLRS